MLQDRGVLLQVLEQGERLPSSQEEVLRPDAYQRKTLLAVVPLDPAGNVEGPGVGEEEGPGQEKAVEVLRQRPHLPSRTHTCFSVPDPPDVSFHHVRLFRWPEPPQPQTRDPRPVTQVHLQPNEGTAKLKRSKAASVAHKPNLTVQWCREDTGTWAADHRQRLRYLRPSACTPSVALLSGVRPSPHSNAQPFSRRHQPACKPPPSDATFWVISAERQLTAKCHPACVLPAY